MTLSLRNGCRLRQDGFVPLGWLLFFVLVLGRASASPAQTPDSSTPAANPSRPTVTNPATLPPVGYLQFEQGYLGSLTSPETSTQYGVNQVSKIAVATRLMLQVQTQPFAVSRETGQSASTTASGDVLLGAQAVLFLPHEKAPDSSHGSAGSQRKPLAPTVSLGYLGRVHSGSTPDVDQGGYAHSLILLLSGDLGAFHYDTNYIINEQTGSDPITNTVRHAQFAQTLSINHSLFNPNLQTALEIYHFTQPLVFNDDRGRPVHGANLVDGLFALSYQLRPNLVLDGGFSHGFTSTSTRWQSFAGFTYLLPHRLWGTRS